jgi:hypothetical protein
MVLTVSRKIRKCFLQCYPSAMPNIQLSAKESVKVFVEIGTDRILGFAPEHSRPLFSGSIRYREHILLHARDIEQWVSRYRVQQERDAEIATYRQIKQESGFRKSIREAIQRRNNHVSPVNRDLNNALIKLMDKRYEQIMEAKMHLVMHTLAEGSEAGKKSDENEIIDFAMNSPKFKNPGDMRATGGSVPADIQQLEHDRKN